jgi:hypothetical protein
LGHLFDRLLAIAFAKVDLFFYCLKRELRARCLNDYVQDDAIVQTNRANEYRSFRSYKDYVDRVELAFEASVAIVLAREFYAFRSFVTRDYYLFSSYDVNERQAIIFVLLVNLATSNLRNVANRCKDLVRILNSSQE